MITTAPDPTFTDDDARKLLTDLESPTTASIAHLNSTHILGSHPLHRAMSIDTTSRLVDALNSLSNCGRTPDVIVITGTLATYGESDAYRSLIDLVYGTAELLGSAVMWAPGEADDHDCLAELLAPADIFEPVVEVSGLRLVRLADGSEEELLNSLVGLAAPTELGIILVMPESPVSSNDILARVIEESDVRAIIVGGGYNPTASQFAQVPVFTAGSTAYTFGGNLFSAPEDVGQTFNIVSVGEDTIAVETLSTRHSAVPSP